MQIKTILSAPELQEANPPAGYFLSGNALSYQLIGKHNEGLLSLSEYLHYFDYLRMLTDQPFILDGQAGFGNPLNTYYSITEMENHGADVILLNDQTHPSHSNKEQQTPAALTEFAGRLKSAMDAHHEEYSQIWLKLDCINTYDAKQMQARLMIAKQLGITDIIIDQNHSIPDIPDLKFHRFNYEDQSILD
ncbi:isocitrate lyase/phosphoenolpyruvate mutase family protein (plasmid) [Nicoliella spurrieriana]|uniref:Isocitrate lyase/phosphoenolpyruvate mutase family protein n=1 Tax=Nicoliella spurrieriana TaxID=2925830 RepID=A0A976X4L6_9LACO|nr:isocitrate lyase/phosphoenolpyruvate mutase family protein [Nicoliella spurrieriana]UQS85950.1 isocitrate lyase/phosphoenolpyruvate mutase family protein [Nicoliella spurrieriana]